MFRHSCLLIFAQHAPTYNNAHNLLRRICLLFAFLFFCFLLVCQAPQRTLTGAWTSHTPWCNCQLQNSLQVLPSQTNCSGGKASFPFQKAQYCIVYVRRGSVTGLLWLLFALKLYDEGSFVLFWTLLMAKYIREIISQPGGATERVSYLKLVQICMLFTRCFIHGSLCNPLWAELFVCHWRIA